MALPALDVFRIRDFRLLWVTTLGSVLGSTMFMLARGYLAFDLTGSAAALGFVALAQGVPMLFLSLVGGVIADRVKKRPLLLFTQLSLAVVGLVTAILVHTGAVQVWYLAALSFTQGIFFAFMGPSRQALMIEIVGIPNVARAVVLNNATVTTMSIIGPALAGFMIALPFLSVTYTMYIVSVVYLASVGALVMIRHRSPAPTRQSDGFAAELTRGLQFIFNHSTLRLLVLAGIVAMVVGNPYQQLLPVFASDQVHDVGASGLGLMSTCIGIGAFSGSVGVAAFASSRHLAFGLVVSGIVFGFGLLLFSLMSSFPFALASLVVISLSFSALQTLNNTMAIMASTPEFYGRVSSIQQFTWALSSLAVLPFGVVVDQIGAPTVITINGLIIATFFFILLAISPHFRLKRSLPIMTETPNPNRPSS